MKVYGELMMIIQRIDVMKFNPFRAILIVGLIDSSSQIRTEKIYLSTADTFRCSYITLTLYSNHGFEF